MRQPVPCGIAARIMEHILSCFVILFVFSCFETVEGQTDFEMLLDKKLFPEGERPFRPVLNQSQAVIVNFGLALRQIINVDEVNQVIITSMWVRMNWINPFLSWDVSEYGGIESINVRPKKMWVPDIVLMDSVDDVSAANLETRLDTNAIVDHNGTVKWLGPTIFKSQCSIQIEHFPFDYQNCTMQFASWTYDGTKLDIRLREHPVVDLSNYVINGEWILHDVPVAVQVTTYECCPEPYPSVVISINLQRRTLFYLYNMIIPCILITFLAFISFFLPPDAGERIGLVITVLLSMAVFLLMVATSIPQTSESTPVISKFFVALMIEVGMALFFTCLLLRMHHKDGGTRMSKWFRVLMFRVVAKLVCYSCNGVQEKYSKEMYELKDQDQNQSGDKDLLLQNAKCKTCQKGVSLNTQGKQLLEDMSIVAERVKRKEHDEGIKNEWKQACQIADRLFFVLFVIVMALTCLCIFESAPYFYA